MLKEWTYEEVEEKAEAIKAIGLDVIYLSKGGEKPWHLATHCEAGGSHRLDIDTSVWFYATSLSGIPLRWSFDIEPPSANGKGSYEIDIAGCRNVLAKLKEPCLSEFRDYLSTCAKAVEKKAREITGWATEQKKTAQKLRLI
jgi:hypothetical protein